MDYVEVGRAHSVRGEVLLRRRPGGVLELRVNGVFVMDTAETSSEEALAREALVLVTEPRTVLVGGLGLGFTTRAVLEDTRVQRVVVAEIEPAVVEWLGNDLVPGGRCLLRNPRLEIQIGDVRELVAAQRGPTYDLVLLDVDNGPGYLVHAANAALYRAPSFEEVRRVLRPGGAVVVWAANEAPALQAAMTAAFGSVDRRTHPVALQDRAEEYLLYLSRVPGGAG